MALSVSQTYRIYSGISQSMYKSNEKKMWKKMSKIEKPNLSIKWRIEIIGSSLKPNHHKQIYFVQIHETLRIRFDSRLHIVVRPAARRTTWASTSRTSSSNRTQSQRLFPPEVRKRLLNTKKSRKRRSLIIRHGLISKRKMMASTLTTVELLCKLNYIVKWSPFFSEFQFQNKCKSFKGQDVLWVTLFYRSWRRSGIWTYVHYET